MHSCTDFISILSNWGEPELKLSTLRYICVDLHSTYEIFSILANHTFKKMWSHSISFLRQTKEPCGLLNDSLTLRSCEYMTFQKYPMGYILTNHHRCKMPNKLISCNQCLHLLFGFSSVFLPEGLFNN